MKPNITKINLIDYTSSDHPWGNTQGKETFRKLSEFIDDHPKSDVFAVSLTGIRATDASFPRESVVAIAKLFRGQKSLFLENVEDRDILDNWKYAAIAKDQPLVVLGSDGYEVIGPETSDSNKALINYVIKQGSVTAAQVANDLDMSVQNASTRLKKLVDLGFFIRSEIAADSGGIEYKYYVINNSD